MKEKYTEKECIHHGFTTFILENRGAYRCRQCRMDRVYRRRKVVIETLKREHGGQCKLCSYDKCLRALEFHHLDPTQKEFGLGQGDYRSIERQRKEAAKCVLLCANCHREVESGITTLSLVT